ncbi:ADP-ribosylglycohydrolase family protein [Luteolibacter flavescens]|uniref:ADP-ribosylglycohydrolase family protein n=1 Tax=Luteolibacter flavescens TaxID=1859460 RepID=A0ABT3FU54_9BACT|nr:ADP-ribosylglycohydrolase family protein [Luteolibacter flavescens]MCW1887100.1 ADP-ribosylglycohydrolase family protein [Luteolibacter flavescens]
MNKSAKAACLLGGALGDSLGLPAEGLNARRIARMWRGEWRHRFFFGRGMVSDDTEHAVMTALSLAKNSRDPDAFAKDLAGRLRWWFAGIPAGVGLATAKSAMKLWLGASPARSGVWSAGNGPLMRAPVIGVHFADDTENRDRFSDASTRITHSDPRALEAARLIAKAATLATDGVQNQIVILDSLERQIESAEMKTRFPLLRSGLADGIDVGTFADSFGRKPGFVSGFAPDTAAVAIFAWLRHRGDFRSTVTTVIAAGGDTDTVAFVAGSLAGIDAKAEGMPPEWIAGLKDWPLDGALLSRPDPPESLRYPVWPLSLVRNGCFLLIVLAHALRRLLPPY